MIIGFANTLPVGINALVLCDFIKPLVLDKETFKNVMWSVHVSVKEICKSRIGTWCIDPESGMPQVYYLDEADPNLSDKIPVFRYDRLTFVYIPDRRTAEKTYRKLDSQWYVGELWECDEDKPSRRDNLFVYPKRLEIIQLLNS